METAIHKRKIRAGLYALYAGTLFLGIAEKRGAPASGGWAIHAWTDTGLQWLAHDGDTMEEAIHDLRVHRLRRLEVAQKRKEPTP